MNAGTHSFAHALLGLAALALGLSSLGCDRSESRRPKPVMTTDPTPMFPSSAILRERSGRGRIAYLGLDVIPKSPGRGESVELVHYFRVLTPAMGDYDVFVHGDVPGSGERVLVGDHAPAEGHSLVSRWQEGEVWVDRHRIAIPKTHPAGTLELYVGMFKGEQRLGVEAPPGAQDGQDRIRAATLVLSGEAPKDDLPVALVARSTSTITADGALDEPAWSKAEVLTLADSMGRPGAPAFPTRLRLLYDGENLYVGFESSDGDVTERYSRRDDPIYEHETVEVFLMPGVIAPALGPYVELQASPGGVIFDAAFTGRRQGMDVGFNAAQRVGTRIDGTLNDSRDTDRGWVSEWVVPWRSLRGVAKAPSAGDEWRMNAFRIEKNTRGGEYTAWSPPRIGDFHNVVRFGRMKFGP